MAGMAVDGLVSGLDTTSLITQLLQAEAAPQAALKTRLSVTQAKAAAYRSVNSKFAAIQAAASALVTAGVTTTKTAKSTDDKAATASATTSATAGSSVTFAVTALAKAQTLRSTTEWATVDTDVRSQQPAWPIEIRKADGTVVGSVNLPPAPPESTLADAVRAINTANLGLKATAVQIGGKYRLQLTSDTTGTASSFVIKSATESGAAIGSGFTEIVPAQDATLDMGGMHVATSPTNTFPDLMSGVSVTVAKADPGAQITVSVGRPLSS